MARIKDDSYFIQKIIEDLAFIIENTGDISLAEFNENEVLQDSMLFRFIQISENVVKLSESFKSINNHIPWFSIKGLRNRVVHDYGNVDLTIVFDTIKFDVPELYRHLQDLK